MNQWRFRTNWRGKLILQRRSVWRDDGRECSEWLDASTEDLGDYFLALSEITK